MNKQADHTECSCWKNIIFHLILHFCMIEAFNHSSKDWAKNGPFVPEPSGGQINPSQAHYRPRNMRQEK